MDEVAKKEENKARDLRLQRAIANDDVDELHNLIGEEQELIDRLSKDPFPHTPLHTAAAAGKIDVVMEMAILKPSFARKLNPEGYSPMHLALQHKFYHIARALIALDPELIRVRGRRGITPLHYVAGKEGNDEVELLAEFLRACRSSIEDLTSRCETAAHVAVKSHNLEAFKVLFGWLTRVYLTHILSWKDKDGNTVLHIAMAEKQPKVIKLLIGYVKIDEKNSEDKTALEIFQANPSGDQKLKNRLRLRGRLVKLLPANLSLSHFLSKELTAFEKITSWFGLQDESARNMILVVATLITTATYQAALTPPGGYWQDNYPKPLAKSTIAAAAKSSVPAAEKPHLAGTIILDGSKLYQFTALNSLVFLASVVTIWVTAIPLLPHTLPVYCLMLILSGAYFATATIVFPEPDEVTGIIITVINMYLLLVGLVLPMYLWINYNRFLRGINTARRHIGDFQELGGRK